MGRSMYTDEFKMEAAKQVTERGYSVADVAKRLGVSPKSLYQWVRKFGGEAASREAAELATLRDENRRLKAQLKRAEEERNILKKAAAYFAKESG